MMLAALLLQATLGSVAPGLRVEGTEFVLTGADGRVRRSAELVGAELDLGNGLTVRIDRVERDAADPQVWLHALSISAGSGWSSLCGADREGKSLGFPLAGSFDAQGTYVADATRFSLTCTSGAQGKCVRFGYAPWRNGADGRSLADAYQACTRMVRADYCGDGIPATRTGTMIDIYDDRGIQRSSSDDDASFRFEAGWSAQGATCVAHTRIPEDTDLAALVARCPRLAAHSGEICSEAGARAAGAVLFNRSR